MLVAGFVRPAAEVDGEGLERAVVPVGAHLRWRGPAFVLIGVLLLAGALALGGGGTLLAWGMGGLARWPLRVAAVTGLYLAPGFALLRLLWPREHALSPIMRLALAPGFSLALPPLLLLLFQLLGLPWGAAATWGYLLLSLLILIGLEIRDWRLRSQRSSISNLQSPTPSTDGVAPALAGISMAALLVRLYSVHDLPVGLLGDSYHHTLIAQLLIDHQGIFQSWQPYAPLATFTYHFGFHANVAFVHWVSGLEATQSVIWAGQVINAIMVPLAFALVVALGGRRWAGVWAAAIVGFVSLLPAFFVNWGRYTQLTGQAVLVVVVVCWIALTDLRLPIYDFRLAFSQSEIVNRHSKISWRLILLVALTTAAMILTHYLITALAMLFVGSYLLTLIVARRSWRYAGALALRGAVAVALALMLAGPWLLNIRNGFLLRNASGIASGTVTGAHVAQLSSLEPIAQTYVRGPVLLAALLGLCAAGWRRDWRMALPAVWCALLVVAVVPYVVGLPGAGVIDNLTALGTLYLPTAMLAGVAVCLAQEQITLLLEKLRRRPPRSQGTYLARAAWLAIVAYPLLMLAIAWGTTWQMQVVTGDTALVTNADIAAMDWVRANTPPDAQFLVNSFPAYGGTLAAGSDAGWWLPLLAHRAASLPPLTYGSELGEVPNYERHVNAIVLAVRRRPLTDPRPVRVDLTNPKVIKALLGNGIEYVYSGAHPSPGPSSADRIDTQLLRASPAFRLIYDRDGVEIFQIQKSTP